MKPKSVKGCSLRAYHRAHDKGITEFAEYLQRCGPPMKVPKKKRRR